MQPNIKRQKTYEMTTKANTIATLLSHGIYGEDVFNAVPFFDDPNEVWQRSRNLIEKYQESIFDKSKDYLVLHFNCKLTLFRLQLTIQDIS